MWRRTQGSLLVTKHYPLYKTYPLVSRTWQQPVTMTIMERRFSRKKTLMKKTLYLEVVIFKTKIILIYLLKADQRSMKMISFSMVQK